MGISARGDTMIFAYCFIFIVCLLLITGISAMSISILFDGTYVAEYQPKRQVRTEVKPIITDDFFEDDDLLLADDILE